MPSQIWREKNPGKTLDLLKISDNKQDKKLIMVVSAFS